MTFLFAHWWTLTILTLTAVLIGVSITGLVTMGGPVETDEGA